MPDSTGKDVRETLILLTHLEAKNAEEKEKIDDLKKAISECFTRLSPSTKGETSTADQLPVFLAQAEEIILSHKPTMNKPVLPPSTSPATLDERLPGTMHAAQRRLAEQMSDPKQLIANLAWSCKTLPLNDWIPAHAHLRRIADERLQGSDFASVLDDLNMTLPSGGEVVGHAHLRRIVHQKFQGPNLISIITKLDRKRPSEGERIGTIEHAALRSQAERISDPSQLTTALDDLSTALPPGDEVVAHSDLRRIARQQLEGYDLISIIVKLNQKRPLEGERVGKDEHTTLRSQTEQISHSRKLAFAIAGLGRMLPLQGEIAAHADLRNIADTRFADSKLCLALYSLSENLPAGGEIAAHADLQRIVTQKLKEPDRTTCLNHLESQRPATTSRKAASFSR